MLLGRRRFAAATLAGVTVLALATAGGAVASQRAIPDWQRGGTSHEFKVVGAVGARHGLPVYGGAPVGVPLHYWGGSVELTNVNYAIFWDPAGAIPSSYKGLIARYFNDVGGSYLFGTTKQYYQVVNGVKQYIQNASYYGGSYVDTTPFPDSDLTDTDLRAAVLRAMSANGWTPGIGHEFFVYTPLGAITLTSFCAKHGSFTSGSQTVLYANMLYGGQPGCETPTSPNGNPAADSVLDSTSHEQWETITDPVVGQGWAARDGEEGSDECGHTYGPRDGIGADTYLNGHPYILQKEWSNARSPRGCVMGA